MIRKSDRHSSVEIHRFTETQIYRSAALRFCVSVFESLRLCVFTEFQMQDMFSPVKYGRKDNSATSSTPYLFPLMQFLLDLCKILHLDRA